jgi:hypothetical protein
MRIIPRRQTFEKYSVKEAARSEIRTNAQSDKLLRMKDWPPAVFKGKGACTGPEEITYPEKFRV